MSIELQKNHPDLAKVRFLACVLPKSDLRFHVSHIKVDENFDGYSTDGARLHYTGDLQLSPGYYKVHKNTKSKVVIEKVHELDTNEGSFPNVTDILLIPDNPGFDVTLQPDYNFKTYTKIIRAMEKTTLNYDFVNDLCSTVNDTASVIVPEPDNNETCKPVHIVKNGYHAVLMPCKIDY